MDRSKINTTLSMTPEEMRSYGYKVVDLLVEHLQELPNKKPVALATSKEMNLLLEDQIPEEGSPAADVLHFVMENVLNNCDLLPHPKFFSYCPSPSNFVSTMADTLATGFNVFSGAWVTSPGATDVEIICINWLLNVFGLPVKEGGGFFTSGGSMANMTGIVTARNVKCGENTSNAVIYMSDQAHSSNSKAAKIVGLRNDQIRIIPSDDDFKLNIELLSRAIAEDSVEGRVPFCVVATLGTTNAGSVDDLDVIADLCEREKLWMHVDAAYGGAAMLSKKKKMLHGVERAHSIAVDPHKWFFQPYEIGCVLVRNHNWLSSTFSVDAEYLRDMKADTGEINFADQGIQLTRRFRALKFYMSLKTFGVASFRAAIDKGIELAEQVEKQLLSNPNWEVVSKANLAVLNYRYNPVDRNLDEDDLDELNHFISRQIIASREAMLTTTKLKSKTVLRMCLINPRTTMRDVHDTITRLVVYAEDFLK